MGLYPLFLKLKDLPCLIVGGGPVAERKAEGLLEAEARLTIISPALTLPLQKRKNQGAFTHINRQYRAGDAKGFFLIVASTGSPRVDGSVVQEALEYRRLIDSVGDPEKSNFFVPSTLRRGDLQIAISTSGRLPLLARMIREALERLFDWDIAADISALSRLREDILRETGDDQNAKERKMTQVLLPAIAQVVERIGTR